MYAGNNPLEGLHKAAAQGDRARIMNIMRVCQYQCISLLCYTK